MHFYVNIFNMETVEFCNLVVRNYGLSIQGHITIIYLLIILLINTYLLSC